jgi:uncharacterized protein (TIGR02145 family)
MKQIFLIKTLFEKYFLISVLLISINGCKKNNDNDRAPATVTDIDGNVYNTIMIGTQLWMKENLKTAHYRNGDPILTGLSDADWTQTTYGAYAIFFYPTILNDTTANNATYGKLYNWFAVTDPRNIAPVGWHVPSDVEWTTLTNYLGGDVASFDKMQEEGMTHWTCNYSGASNSSGFTALPGGVRSSYDGSFAIINVTGEWWSTTENNAGTAWLRDMTCNNYKVFRDNGAKQAGMSVRCVKDQ